MMDNRTNKRKNYPGEDRFLVYILLLPPALYTLTVSVCVCVGGCVGRGEVVGKDTTTASINHNV